METIELSSNEIRKDARRLLREYGGNLRSRRKERGITMIELSERAGVSCEDIDGAERGLVAFTEEEKQRIGKVLSRQRII